MHKVRFVIPSAMPGKAWASSDPKDYIPTKEEGWMLDIEPEPLIFYHDARGFWYVTDPVTGRRLNSNGYRTRRDAMKDAQRWSDKLHEFKTSEASRDTFRKLADLTETLAHELELIERGRAAK